MKREHPPPPPGTRDRRLQHYDRYPVPESSVFGAIESDFMSFASKFVHKVSFDSSFPCSLRLAPLFCFHLWAQWLCDEPGCMGKRQGLSPRFIPGQAKCVTLIGRGNRKAYNRREGLILVGIICLIPFPQNLLYYPW